MDILVWLEASAIADWVRTVRWVYPALESAHYLGLAMLVGSIMVIDLRLLGFAKLLPLKSVIGLVPWVWAGFIVNAISGGLIFIYGATGFAGNRAFQLKMILMLLAGVNALIFTLATRRADADWLDSGVAPTAIKSVATASFILWLGVVTAGRWMAYI